MERGGGGEKSDRHNGNSHFLRDTPPSPAWVGKVRGGGGGGGRQEVHIIWGSAGKGLPVYNHDG